MERDTVGSLKAIPGALIRMGCALMGSGKGGQAHALLRRLQESAPGDAELESASRVILSHRVPHWHEAMLLDEERNGAFEQAIARSVSPGGTVLDIGTGSGLLAMMAARAGASKVVACEAHPALAATAAEIVGANGFSGVVTVIAKPSTELDAANDLGGGADLIVAEVFSDDLLNEGALATLHDARTRLGTVDARVIPAGAAVRLALARLDRLPKRLGEVRGFDLSRFERHAAPERKLKVGDPGLSLASEPADLFLFDFTSGAPFAPAKTQLRLASEFGRSNGVVQWIRLQLDEETAYENRPGPGARSHWAALFHPFPEGRTLEKGSTVTVHAAHDLERLQIWFE